MARMSRTMPPMPVAAPWKGSTADGWLWLSTRALEGLDGGRVVVALDLESDRLAVAEVDDAGVLAGALQHSGPAGRKPPQQAGRVLVAAVLRPEQ
jgi:hypothetical protein